MKNSISIKTNLHWRIWYIYIVSMLCSRGFVAGVALSISAHIFRELVFIRMVIKNFLSVEVGKVPMYTWHILTTTEPIKLLALACIGASVWLFCMQLRRRTVTNYPFQTV